MDAWSVVPSALLHQTNQPIDSALINVCISNVEDILIAPNGDFLVFLFKDEIYLWCCYRNRVLAHATCSIGDIYLDGLLAVDNHDVILHGSTVTEAVVIFKVSFGSKPVEWETISQHESQDGAHCYTFSTYLPFAFVFDARFSVVYRIDCGNKMQEKFSLVTRSPVLKRLQENCVEIALSSVTENRLLAFFRHQTEGWHCGSMASIDLITRTISELSLQPDPALQSCPAYLGSVAHTTANEQSWYVAAMGPSAQNAAAIDNQLWRLDLRCGQWTRFNVPLLSQLLPMVLDVRFCGSIDESDLCLLCISEATLASTAAPFDFRLVRLRVPKLSALALRAVMTANNGAILASGGDLMQCLPVQLRSRLSNSIDFISYNQDSAYNLQKENINNIRHILNGEVLNLAESTMKYIGEYADPEYKGGQYNCSVSGRFMKTAKKPGLAYACPFNSYACTYKLEFHFNIDQQCEVPPPSQPNPMFLHEETCDIETTVERSQASVITKVFLSDAQVKSCLVKIRNTMPKTM